MKNNIEFFVSIFNFKTLMSIFTFRKNKEVLIHKIETVCECKCKCKCKCENILEYLKNNNPNDFCNYENCLKWNNLL